MLTLWKPQRVSMAERFFNDFFEDRDLDSYYESHFSPNVDIRETNDHVLIEAELAGMNKADIKVLYENGGLKISGEKKTKEETKDEYCHRTEMRYGKFQRIIPLNEDYIKADSIDAQYDNGILKVTIDKAEHKKPKEIEVKVK